MPPVLTVGPLLCSEPTQLKSSSRRSLESDGRSRVSKLWRPQHWKPESEAVGVLWQLFSGQNRIVTQSGVRYLAHEPRRRFFGPLFSPARTPAAEFQLLAKSRSEFWDSYGGSFSISGGYAQLRKTVAVVRHSHKVRARKNGNATSGERRPSMLLAGPAVRQKMV